MNSYDQSSYYAWDRFRVAAYFILLGCSTERKGHFILAAVVVVEWWWFIDMADRRVNSIQTILKYNSIIYMILVDVHVHAQDGFLQRNDFHVVEIILH